MVQTFIISGKLAGSTIAPKGYLLIAIYFQFFEIQEINFMSQLLSTFRGFSSLLIRARMFFVALGGILLLSGMAQASIIPSLVAGPVNIGGGQFRYDYQITLSADERLDPAATNGVTCPGPSNSNVQCNPAGTFVTIYDVPGFVSASATAPFFTTNEALTGPTPNSINGAAFDSTSLINVTYTYNGPVINGPATFGGFSIVTTFSGVNPVGNFTSQSTNNTSSTTSGTSDQVIGSVPIPIGPSAATATVSGKIVTSGGRGVRGIKVTITGTNDGESKTVLSGQFGYYSFPDMQVGQTYIITASGKQYGFTQSTQVQTVLDDTPNINFYAFNIGRFE